MAASEGGSGGLTEYIGHHLTHWTVNQGHGAFWAFHLDSVAFTVGLALIFVLLFHRSSRSAPRTGVPGKTAGRGRNSGRDGRRNRQGDLPRHEPADRPAGHHHLRAGIPDESSWTCCRWICCHGRAREVGDRSTCASSSTADINTTLGMSITVFSCSSGTSDSRKRARRCISRNSSRRRSTRTGSYRECCWRFRIYCCA